MYKWWKFSQILLTISILRNNWPILTLRKRLTYYKNLHDLKMHDLKSCRYNALTPTTVPSHLLDHSIIRPRSNQYTKRDFLLFGSYCEIWSGWNPRSPLDRQGKITKHITLLIHQNLVKIYLNGVLHFLSLKWKERK